MTEMNRLKDYFKSYRVEEGARYGQAEPSVAGWAVRPSEPSEPAEATADAFAGTMFWSCIAGHEGPHGARELPELVTDETSERLLQNVRIASLEMKVAELEARLDRAGPAGSADSLQECDPKILDVIAVTQEMFSGTPSIEVMADPEDPDNRFIVITVKSAGAGREAVQKRLQWHARISELRPGNSGSIRLSIEPR